MTKIIYLFSSYQGIFLLSYSCFNKKNLIFGNINFVDYALSILRSFIHLKFIIKNKFLKFYWHAKMNKLITLLVVISMINFIFLRQTVNSQIVKLFGKYHQYELAIQTETFYVRTNLKNIN